MAFLLSRARRLVYTRRSVYGGCGSRPPAALLSQDHLHLNLPRRPSSSSTGGGGEVIVSARDVSFEYLQKKPILKGVDFSIRDATKVTIMGQNGAGKSTILKLLSGIVKPEAGEINIKKGLAVATAMQVMPRDLAKLSVWDFFKHQMHGNESGLDSRIARALNVVQLEAAHDRIVSSFSGGQQARLLLASALLGEPDLLLLDEPTNNLDKDGIYNLTGFLQDFNKTAIVISHDEHFLNSFTDAVLYLDVFSKKVEQYDGDYNTVKDSIARRIASENAENARLTKAAQAKKDQANKFANKGGNMRKAAQKLKDEAEKLQSSIVQVRKEDRSLRPFEFPLQEAFQGKGSPPLLLEATKVRDPANRNRLVDLKNGPLSIHRGTHVRITGPNGIGKTTLLEDLASCTLEGSTVNKSAVMGYYRQDFSLLDFDETVHRTLLRASDGKHTEQDLRKTAAQFLLEGDVVKQKISSLSEGQKGLLSFACLVLQEPAVLVVDEPTNHINFRHLPSLAAALSTFKGGLVLVSHDEAFVKLVRIDETLDLGAELLPQ